MQQLSSMLAVKSAITPTAGASGTAAIEGTILDTAGYEGVMVIVYMGAMTGNATLKLRQGDDSSLTDAADLTGTGVTVESADEEQMVVWDLFRPRDRYVQLHVTRDVGSSGASTVAAAIYVPYTVRKEETTIDATDETTLVGRFISPAEGTA